MAHWIKNVDPKWFDFVSSQPTFEEINLWTPGPRRSFDSADTGDIVLFRIEGRRSQIVGYGLYFDSAIYWAADAWEIFGEKNGAETFEALIEQIRSRRNGRYSTLYAIACHNIVQPIYFGSDLRARLPSEVLRRLGTGPIDEEEPDGQLLLQFLGDMRIRSPYSEVHDAFPHLTPESQRLVIAGRSGFRMAVTEAYGRSCTVTGETVLPCLDAAHFVALRHGGANVVRNGLLLRRDLHPLLDSGYLAISHDYRVMISAWLPRAYQQSRSYLELDGAPLRLPANPDLWPDPDAVRRHRDMPFFKGGQFEM